MIRNVHRQPKALYSLFFTELWERFGFYLVQTILILYITKGLHYPDQNAYLLYGAFSSMLYLTPVLGGYLADKYIGFRQAIILGGILFIIGYGLMGIPDIRAFFMGLSITTLANGLFKPNVSSILGDLYEGDDPRRDGGFTLFYMGINIGSLLPPIFAGALVDAFSWSSGFYLASFGMVISLATFGASQKLLGNAGKIPSISPLHRGKKGRFYGILIFGICVLTAFFNFLFRYPKEADLILIAASLAVIASVLFFFYKEHPERRKKLIACLILIIISIGFWAVYTQTYSSLMLFADRNMGKKILGFTINTEFTQFFNPFFIIILSPFLSWLWIHLDRKKKNPSTPVKFSLGALFMGFGFLFLWAGIRFFNQGDIASPWWLIGSYLLQTIGELLLSPIGLAMVTRLAPRHLVGMMMGVWFLSLSAAFAIGGGLATLSDVAKTATRAESLAAYDHAFLIYGLLSIALAILSFSLVPYLRRLIGIPSALIQTPKE